MKQILVQSGNVSVIDVPAPQVSKGCVLVETVYSCISTGTEMSSVNSTSVPLWKRVMERPEQVKRVAKMVAVDGFKRTKSVVKSKLKMSFAIGYSASGRVIAVGEGIDDIFVGDRVSCSGSQCAYHAEILNVPRNLVCKIDDDLSFKNASTATLGAIAMQGVRRAEPSIGETYIVIGLGILGQLTVQLLKNNGVNVIAIDLDDKRLGIALQSKADICLHSIDEASEQKIARLTHGIGADGVIITAASSSDQIISDAFKMCRKKGKVVLVGDIGLNINRADIYAKELDFKISTSYGPGRYDNQYEEKGIDYPVSYVRWTENRNIQSYLSLLAQAKISLDHINANIFDIDDAGKAYRSLADDSKPMLAYLQYQDRENKNTNIVYNFKNIEKSNLVRLAVIGAGEFATFMHLPIIQAHSDKFSLQAIVTREGHKAYNIANQFNAKYAATDYQDVLKDESVNAVMIATRHHLHGEMVINSLKAGKHVFVEKPLCLSRQELEEIEAFYKTSTFQKPLLMTGYNRRFSPYIIAVQKALLKRHSPMVINYTVNANYVAANSWLHGEEGGGRNLGEACHFYDIFLALTKSTPKSINAFSVCSDDGYDRYDDNFTAIVTFKDGSIANLTYTSLGHSDYPKEKIEVFCDNIICTIDDFKRLMTYGSKKPRLNTAKSQKGHEEELLMFASAILNAGEWPITLQEQICVSEIAFKVQDCLEEVKGK